MITYLIIKFNSIFHHANQREKYGSCNCILVHKYWIQSSHVADGDKMSLSEEWRAILSIQSESAHLFNSIYEEKDLRFN